MEKLNKNHLLHAISVIIFLTVSIIFYYPAIFQSKIIHQYDVVNYHGVSKESDDYFFRTGKWPLWINSMFCGMPAYQVSTRYDSNLFSHLFYGTVNHGLYSGNFLFFALLGFYILLITFDVHALIAMGGALAYGFSTYFFVIVKAGHNSKMMALALIPPVVAGVIQIYRGKYVLGVLLTGLFFALNLVANHIQMTYYFYMVILIFVLLEFYHAFKNRTFLPFLKSSGVLSFVTALAVLSDSSSIWMTYEYGKSSTRGKSELTMKEVVKTEGLDKDYATQWSYGISEIFTLLVPDFAGRSNQNDIGTKTELFKYFNSVNPKSARNLIEKAPTYWGAQPFTDGPFYLGASVCFLFVLAMVFIRGKLKVWLLTATILSILLAWGKNFMFFSDIFLEYFPLYSKFRAVATILVICVFTIPLMAFLGLNRFFEDAGAEIPLQKGKTKISIFKTPAFKKLFRAFLITAGLSLFLVLFGKYIFDFSGPNDEKYKTANWPLELLKKERMLLMRDDALRSFFFILLSATVLFLFLKGWFKKEIAIVLLSMCVLADLGFVSKRFLNNTHFVKENDMKMAIVPTNANTAILKQEMNFNPRIRGYADTLMNIYVERKKEEQGGGEVILNEDEKLNFKFMALNALANFRVLNTTTTTFSESNTSYFHKSLGGYHGAKLKRFNELIEYQITKNNHSVWNMLNTKYYILKDSNKQIVAQLNPDACGNAWFVRNVKWVASADSELVALSGFKPIRTALIDKRFTYYLDAFTDRIDTTAWIRSEKQDLEYLAYRSHSGTEQVCLFSEIYYEKGWKAAIDGKEVPHIRANYVLRALRIPPGDHLIEFRFEPENYYRSQKISFAASLALILMLFSAGLFLFLKKEKRKM